MYDNTSLPASLLAPRSSKSRRLTVLQGLPASGKSSAARKAQAATPGRVAVINNDGLSEQLTGVSYADNIKRMAKLLSRVRRTMIVEALKTPEITLIIIDNTNLNSDLLEEYKRLAEAFGVEFVVEDSFLSVPVDECIRRDSLRVHPVGEEVILRMSKAAKTRGRVPGFMPGYVSAESKQELPKAIIIDLDPVLRWLRNATVQDWANIYRRKLPSPAIELVKVFKEAGMHVIGVTSLSEQYAPEANVWVNLHVIPGMQLHMHSLSDSNRSMMSKHSAYYNDIKPFYDVVGVIGEKEEVVHVWKNIAGLPTYQISFGDF